VQGLSNDSSSKWQPSADPCLAKLGGRRIALLSISDLVSNKRPMTSDTQALSPERIPAEGSSLSIMALASARSTTASSYLEDSVCSSFMNYELNNTKMRMGRRKASPRPSPRQKSPGRGSSSSMGALPPKGTALKFPEWAVGTDINDKYMLMWDDRIAWGGLNSLNRMPGLPGAFAGCSCMIKAKTRKAKALRAVKVIPKEHILYPKLFQSQLSAYTACDHPNICKLMDLYEDSSYVYLVMEHLAGPSLLEKALADPHFCERDAAAAIKSLLQVVAYLHEQNVVHQNIHPENLRFLTNFRTGPSSDYAKGLKLMDFGLCIQVKHITSVLSASGEDDARPPPPLQAAGSRSSGGDCCLAPELGVNKEAATYSEMAKLAAQVPNDLKHLASLERDRCNDLVHEAMQSSDIWSVGCIMHLLLSGSKPPEEALSRSTSAKLPAGIHRFGHDLCSVLLDPNPMDRPTAAQALTHKWFSHCALIKHGHRTVSAPILAGAVTPVTPISVEVHSRLGGHHAQCHLRKLLLGASALLAFPFLSLETWPADAFDCITEEQRSQASSILPVPPTLFDSKLKIALKAVYNQCQVAFSALLRTDIATTTTLESGLLSEQYLMELMDQAKDLRLGLDPRTTLSKVRSRSRPHPGVSMHEFAEFIFKCVCE